MKPEIPHGIFTKARLLARGISETEVHQAIKDNNSVRKEGLRMRHHGGYKI